MDKKIIVGIVIGLIILIGGAFAFMYQNKSMSPSDKMASKIRNAKSLKELLAIKDSQQCTFDHENADTKTSGKIYLANGQMKSEFTTQYNNQEATTYMVVKDDILYAWENESKTGISLPLQQYWDAQENENFQTPVKANEKVDYKCSSWSDENESFEIPSDIQFTSMQEMMDQLIEVQNQMMQDDEIDCSICDQVPAGSAQDQCRMALGC